MTADWVGPMILLNKPNETLLKGFLTEVLKIFTKNDSKKYSSSTKTSMCSRH